MRALLLILGLISCLLPTFGQAQEAPPSRTWHRSLADQGELIELATALSTALEAGDLDGIGRQFQADRIGLAILSDRLPLSLYGHSQGRAILQYYLADRSLQGVHVVQAKLAAGGSAAQVALDAPSSRQFGGRPHRQRFVASYRLTDKGWCLSRLRCP